MEGPNSGWGYEIYHTNKLLIRQQHIPGVPGEQYFRSEKEASRIAELVIEKLKKGQSPTVEISELIHYEINFQR